MTSDLSSEIQAELGHLSPDAQRRVLEFVLSLKNGESGTPGTVVAKLAGTISPDELKLIEEAIENGCEQVDLNEW